MLEAEPLLFVLFLDSLGCFFPVTGGSGSRRLVEVTEWEIAEYFCKDFSIAKDKRPELVNFNSGYI